jgi:hypothetical protein
MKIKVSGYIAYFPRTWSKYEKDTKQPKINHMLIGAYFNVSYEQYWQQAWLPNCDSKKQML